MMQTAAAVLLLVGLQCAAAGRSSPLAGSSLLAPLKEAGDAPLRMVACIGSQGTGKSTLMRTMFGTEVGAETLLAEDGLVLLEAESSYTCSGSSGDSTSGATDAAVAVVSSDVVVYNVFLHDLARSSMSILSELQPAMEKVLSMRAAGLTDSLEKKSLIIAVRDYDEKQISKSDVTSAVTAHLRSMWGTAVKPEAVDAAAAAFEDYFDLSFSFLPHSKLSSQGYATGADALRSDLVRSGVRASAADLLARYRAASAHVGSTSEPPAQKEMAAAYSAKSAAAQALGSYKSLASTLLRSTTEALDPEFGARVDSIVSDVLKQYDEAVSAAGGSPNSGIASKKRDELQRAMVRDMHTLYLNQLALLRAAAADKFKRAPATLRITPSMAKDMDTALKEALKYYDEAVAGLKSKNLAPLHANERKELLSELRATASERLQLAKLQGADLSAKSRKSVGVGFHWLLPEPFGTDAKQSILSPKDESSFVADGMTADILFFDFQPLDAIPAPEGAAVKSGQWDRMLKQKRLRKRAEGMVNRRGAVVDEDQ